MVLTQTNLYALRLWVNGLAVRYFKPDMKDIENLLDTIDHMRSLYRQAEELQERCNAAEAKLVALKAYQIATKEILDEVQ
jgi:hypothetical protein